ncbi:hypothetical protein ACHWQZ_G018439 [Mnemiopsis leidyi]
MFTKILLGCMVLGLTQACNHQFMKNGASCYSGNNCAFGCTKSGECWSQCDGLCCLTTNCLDGDLSCTTGCALPEWCYVVGNSYDSRTPCKTDSDCGPYNKLKFPYGYKCSGACSV